MSEFILAHGIRVIDLVSENQEGDLGELFHGEEGVEFGLGFGESLAVLGVDEEDDSADFGEVVFPEAAGYEFVLAERDEVGKERSETHPAGDRPSRRS
jgi:hypothetical protein